MFSTPRRAGILLSLACLLGAGLSAAGSAPPPGTSGPGALGAEVPGPVSPSPGTPKTAPVVEAGPPVGSAPGGLKPELLLPEGVHPGEALLLWVLGDQALAGAKVELHDAAGKLRASASLFEATPLLGELPAGPPAKAAPASTAIEPPRPGLFGAVLGLGFDLVPGPHRIGLVGLRGEAAAATLLVEPKSYLEEEVKLDAANSALRTEADPKKTEEAKLLFALYATADPRALFADAALLPPVGQAQRSANFGDRRTYRYAKGGSETTIHAGVDFAVPIGTPVQAPARGRVVFAGARIVTGTTLVLEHLPGLFSVYMHLSAILVAPGQVVEPGDTLATSGSTGLSTGPHLHWELRAGAVPVDPSAWPGRAPLDKERIKARIVAAIEGR